MININISTKKRMRTSLFVVFLVIAILIGRLGYIQLIDGKKLSELAYEQQTLDRAINPKRGTIYDVTGQVLAQSSTVETITVNPGNIDKKDKEKVAQKLSEIFELDYENTLKKVSKRSSIETIAKKVNKDKADELRKWIEEENISTGINIDEDTKRYYPYGTLASNVIGFTGSDNQGLEGIESRYDSILKGEQGKILKLTDATGSELGTAGEDYVEAVNGDDLILSIDMTIQAIAEKYLAQACVDNVCTGGGNIIISNPKTGDILAMANYPNYNLNEPYLINEEDLKIVWDDLSAGDKSNALAQMWRNKAISDTYEPGSTFKLVTASASLEEGITDTDRAGEFCCTGSINIAGTRIKCWRYYRPHGAESLRQALMNSCNPVFIGLRTKIRSRNIL